MKSFTKSFSAVAIAFVASSGAAFAGPIMNVPEPSSMALVGLAVAGVLAISRKAKK